MAGQPSDPGRVGLLPPLPVLFTHFGDPWIRGSETLLLDLLARLDPARVQPIVWCNGVEMAEACRKAGHITQRSDFAFYFDAGSPPFDRQAWRGLLREATALARQHQVGVFHANSAAPTQWLLPAARNLRLPLLTHLHTGYLRRSRHVLLLHLADSLIGVSRHVLDGLRHDLVPESRLRVIPNGIDFGRLAAPTAADFRVDLGIPAGALVIGAPGSLIHRKGLDVLIQAFGRLDADAHLLIAGSGPEHEALLGLTARLGLTDRVHFIGFSDTIGDFYRACDIVALASRAEAFGLVLVEAGFFGLPVVATTVGGIPEVVIHDATGLLAAPDDVSALAAALQRLASDAALRARLGAAGKFRAQTQFSADRMAAAFHAEYDRLAALPSASLGWSAAIKRLPTYRGVFRR